MHVNSDGIGGRATGGRCHVRDSGSGVATGHVCRRRANGIIRNAAAGVAVPGAGADLAVAGIDVRNAHVAGAVGVGGHADGGAEAVGRGRGQTRPDLAIVQRLTICGVVAGERDVGELPGHRAGVTESRAVIRRDGVFAADNRCTEGKTKEKKNQNTVKPTHPHLPAPPGNRLHGRTPHAAKDAHLPEDSVGVGRTGEQMGRGRDRGNRSEPHSASATFFLSPTSTRCFYCPAGMFSANHFTSRSFRSRMWAGSRKPCPSLG